MSFDPAQDLGRYRRELADAERAVAGLRKVVAALEEVVGDDAKDPLFRQAPRERLDRKGSVPISGGVRTRTSGRRGTARGGKSVKDVLRELMADGQRRTVEGIIEQIERRGDFPDGLPARATLTNRLSDLVDEDYLRHVRRGVYELASPNGDGSQGDDQSRLTEGIPSPEGQEGKPPRPMSAHGGGGHPDGGGSAEVASRS